MLRRLHALAGLALALMLLVVAATGVASLGRAGR